VEGSHFESSTNVSIDREDSPMTKQLLLAAAAFGLTLAMPGLAEQGQGKGKAKGQDKVNVEEHSDSHKTGHKDKAVKAFAKRDRDIIMGFFREQPGGLPPGLAKRDTLPPGLEKQLRRNGHLPPGLEKKIEPFPPGLAAHFPPLEPGYRRGLVGGMAVLFQPGGLIVDLLDLR
jgi:hypothetical protein